MSRESKIESEVRRLLSEISGVDAASLDADSSFLELGLDSLVLTQVALTGSKRFKVGLKLRHLLEDHSSLRALTAFLAAQLPADFGGGAAAVTVSAAPPAAATPVAFTPSAGAVERTVSVAVPELAPVRTAASRAPAGAVADVVRAQLALMERQLELLGGARRQASESVPATAVVDEPAPVAVVPANGASPVAPSAAVLPNLAASAVAASPATTAAPAVGPDGKPQRHGPQLVIDKSHGSELSPTQEKHLAKLIARYTERTAKSKAFTARNRVNIADPRVPSGFRPRLKEIVYPLVVDRSSGARLWDIDGNEYVDMLNGYGSNFFGYGAPFVQAAVTEQMARGMDIGPQTPLVEEVAELFRKLVPCDRLAFCNTGSEAVLATLRMARTATGRDRVVMFTGGYHGIFDEVVARPMPNGKSVPAAPGIPRSATENLAVLEWASDSALSWIEQNAEDIAAVLVEPVQSRRPELQPVEFLKALRALTERLGIVLIFDEVVTGFRFAPGGAQEHFGIQADLASYGKVVGGGLSIGVVAGRREFMDALDGGGWNYGDDSIPEVGVTYFAGTFVRHPVHLAAAKAALSHMVERGPALQRSVSARTDELALRLNALFREQGAPLELRHYASLIKLVTTEVVPYGEILQCHLRERGVHVWDGRPSFLTAAHGDAELDHIVGAFRGAIEELQDGGFYRRLTRSVAADAPPAPGARLGRDPQGKPAWFVPDPGSPGRYKQLEVAS